LFYTLQWATVAFCDRPSKVYKARASLSFISAVSLFLSLLAVTFPLGYAIFRFPSSGSYMPTYTLDENLGNITGAACSSSTFVLSQCYPRTSAEETAYDAIATVCYISPANDDLAPQGYNPTYPNGLQATVGAICAVCPTGCGLFRNKETAYTIFTEEIETWSNASQAILAFITTAPFMATVMFMFLVYVLLLHQTAEGAKMRIDALERERDLEREDKLWILDKYAIILDSAHNTTTD
jgi:hypothetical protein